MLKCKLYKLFNKFRFVLALVRLTHDIHLSRARPRLFSSVARCIT